MVLVENEPLASHYLFELTIWAGSCVHRSAVAVAADVAAMFSPLDITPLQDDFSELKRRLTDLMSWIQDSADSDTEDALSLNQENRATITRIQVLAEGVTGRMKEGKQTESEGTRERLLE